MEDKRAKNEKRELASAVIDFCLEYGIFNPSCEISELKRRVEEQFCDCVFVEGLINRIIVKTKNRDDIDVGKLVALLVGLEKIRLTLEYRGEKKC